MAVSHHRFLIYEDQLIGQGAFSSVYKGEFRSKTVANKIIRSDQPFILGVDDYDLMRLDHPYLVKLHYISNPELSTSSYTRSFSLDLAEVTLSQTYLPESDDRKYRGPLPTPLNGLVQLSDGLSYIHSKGLVYKQVKPSSVLVFRLTRGHQSCSIFKWGDFGLSEETPLDHWRAPETIATSGRIVTFESDVFVAGILFFYYLVGGIHPFGYGKTVIQSNIQQHQLVNIAILPQNHLAYSTIRLMLKHAPQHRNNMPTVYNNFLEILKSGLNFDLERGDANTGEPTTLSTSV